MQIREIYEISHSIGVLGGSSPREYIDVYAQQKKPGVKGKKRQTFIAELQKRSKNIPGPGKYVINPEEPKKTYKRVDMKLQQKKTKKNFIEEIVKLKNGVPGVGKYEIINDNSDKIREWHSIRGSKEKKKALQFKSSIFDDVHVDCINVGPASYQTQQPFVKINKFQTNSQAPIENNESKEKQKKRSNSLPKLPGAQTYRPVPTDFDTFQKLLLKKGQIQHSDFSKQKRFSNQKQKGPGPKYSLIAQWSPRKNKRSVRNIFKSVSNLRSASIYH